MKFSLPGESAPGQVAAEHDAGGVVLGGGIIRSVIRAGIEEE